MKEKEEEGEKEKDKEIVEKIEQGEEVAVEEQQEE